MKRAAIEIAQGSEVVEDVRCDNMANWLSPSAGITNADVEICAFVGPSANAWVQYLNCTSSWNNASCPATVALTAFLLCMLCSLKSDHVKCNSGWRNLREVYKTGTCQVD